MRYVVSLACLIVLTACGQTYRDTSVPLVAQADFNAEDYLGLWYEVARFPVFFQKGCTATTAEYGPIDADTVSVLNTCRQGTPDGPIDQIAGKAEVVGPGQLKVSFNNVPFARGDYTVLWVDETYQTAVVGTSSGKSGWILARTPQISADKRNKAEAVMRANGYDTSLLIDVPHG